MSTNPLQCIVKSLTDNRMILDKAKDPWLRQDGQVIFRRSEEGVFKDWDEQRNENFTGGEKCIQIPRSTIVDEYYSQRKLRWARLNQELIPKFHIEPLIASFDRQTVPCSTQWFFTHT